MHNKNILLLYITEVSGHHSASLAIEKSLKAISADLKILNLNAFHYTSPISEKVVNRIYTTVIKRTPKIWDFVYDNPKVKKSIDKFKNAINKFNSPKLKRLFDQFRPDIVVCTQAYPCGMVAQFKKTYQSKVPLVGVLTDFIPHSYWLYDNVDYYICPSQEISRRLAEKGIPEHKIKPLGIPFDPGFLTPVNKPAVLEKLGFSAEKKTVLIMGGGQGLGPIKTIVQSLDRVKSDFQEIIITGTNKKLYKSLKKDLKKFKKKICLLGYVHNVNELMSVSDLIITKPGGITTSEALSKGLPMLIIKPIPGQEANNTVYLTEQKAALKIVKPKEINLIVENLFTNPEKLKRISEACSRIAKPSAGTDIARFILSLSHV
ncbi:MAG: glycosyltransferase [Candidatus Omnitrophica bacterium]|nr:glycosyltransferase [Candidatus Omnitrophota bacterium]